MTRTRSTRSASGGTATAKTSPRLASTSSTSSASSADATGLTKVGKGVVVYANKSPAKLSRMQNGGDQVRQIAREAMDATGVAWHEANALVLRRGPYLICGGLDDAAANASPVHAQPAGSCRCSTQTQPMLREYRVTPGARAVLVDVDRMPSVGVIAAACRVREQKIGDGSLSFQADGQAETNAVASIKLPAAPKTVTLDGQPLDDRTFADGVLRVRFENRHEPRKIEIGW